MNLGYIHSIESMGLVDGPGVRTVVFMQGCNLRCKYCHNPDTWKAVSEDATIETPQSLFEKIIRFKPYYGNDGGVTFSGGEPLLQSDFLSEIIPMCKDAGISVCLDTAGFYDGDFTFFKYIDLILFDIKHYVPEKYKEITGRNIEISLNFLDKIQKMDIPLWIRHVVVPGLTDSNEHLQGLYDYIKHIKNVRKIELLPYHILGIPKYESLGIAYPLAEVEPMDKSKLFDWQAQMNELTKQEEIL